MSRFLSFAVVLTLVCAPAIAEDLPGTGKDEGKTVIYRDTWGVAHIYAPTDTAGLFAQGYATAEDRPEQLIINLLAAVGKLSAIAGPDAVNNDLRSIQFNHYGVAREKFGTLKPKIQEHLQAYADGINHFYETHPEKRPIFWQGQSVDPYMLIAFGRLFLYNWSIDEAYEDLKRGGVEAGYDDISRGSNQFAVSPQRSATGNAILAIDPHLSWFDFSRFWECRIHAGDLHGSGVTLPGSPYIGLGHNANLAWSMTTGGPDTADIYVLTLKDDDSTKYKYEGEWRDLTSQEVTLNVRGLGEQKHTLWYSHHGPIIAMRDGKAYAAKTSYYDIVDTSGAWYELNYAEDYSGAVKAMETLAMFPQNVMVADTKGNIYYQRTGRVPKRSTDFDWTLPVDGSIGATEWQGIHPSSDHLQVLNPPQGYMQNCNVPPDAMMPGSPFKFEAQPSYLYTNAEHTLGRFDGAIHNWTNQRGARAIELLSQDQNVTVAEAMEVINDVHPYHADRWVELLRRAHESYGAESLDSYAAYQEGVKDIWNWNGGLYRDSTAALKYYYWREQIEREVKGQEYRDLINSVDDWYHIVDGRPAKPLPDHEPMEQMLTHTFSRAMKNLRLEHGSLNATFGDHFRVGRGEKSWPVGGGSLYESRTLRSMSYGGKQWDYTQWGRGGQTSTQIVELSTPIKSWIYIPLGESDDPASPHYSDQAEKAFSSRTLKPSWWLPEDLKGHIESRTVLDYKG